jgi:hypothetical protein
MNQNDADGLDRRNRHLNTWVSSTIFVAGLGVAGAAQADAPALFGVLPESTKVLYATTQLNQGDVLQVRSTRLLGDEALVLARCANDCTHAQIVSIWRHGFHDASGINNRVIRSNIRLPENGRYFFWLIKNSECYVDPWSCRNSAWPGILTYGNPQALAITNGSNDGAYFKAKYASGSLIYVRRLPARNSS